MVFAIATSKRTFEFHVFKMAAEAQLDCCSKLGISKLENDLTSVGWAQKKPKKEPKQKKRKSSEVSEPTDDWFSWRIHIHISQ